MSYILCPPLKIMDPFASQFVGVVPNHDMLIGRPPTEAAHLTVAIFEADGFTVRVPLLITRRANVVIPVSHHSFVAGNPATPSVVVQ